MNKGGGFFSNLKKSTKITLISCGCFIAMTLVILIFFICFPITPSEKVIASFGREGVAKKKNNNSQVVTTTMNAELQKGTTMTTSVTTMKTTRHKQFTITVTKGDGFYSGGYIATGQYPYEYSYGENYTTTTTAEPYYNEEPYYQENPDPNGGSGQGYNEEPVQEPVTAAPQIPDEPVIPEPTEAPVAPVEGGGETGGDVGGETGGDTGGGSDISTW